MINAADLVFDLDGTICDPFLGIYRSINFALEHHGIAETSESAVAKLIGPPLDEGFRLLLPEANDETIRSLVHKYRERYAQVGFSENSLYAGIAEELENLADLGLTLGVCTSKRVDFAEKILQLFGLREYFSFVDGGDVGIKKSKQLAALLEANLVNGSSIMIGDRDVDILSAHANGLRSAGVLWGYGSEAELVDAGAQVLLSSPSELSTLADSG